MNSRCKTYAVENNGVVRLVTATTIQNTISKGVYGLSVDDSGYHLIRREDLITPSKIYGKSTFPERVGACFKKFQEKEKGMAVLLTGPKGTGKTVEAKLISNLVDLPIILITHGFSGPGFVNFISSITQPVVFFIDEFEKVFEYDKRNQFLTILDGVTKSRHLFIMTSNTTDIGRYFINRPGRVRYHKDYQFLSRNDIDEIIDDKLENKKWKNDIKKYFSEFSNISIDNVVSVIEEVNLFDESPLDFADFFNVRNEKQRHQSYDLSGSMVTKNGLVLVDLKDIRCLSYKNAGSKVLSFDYDREMYVFKSETCSHFEITDDGFKWTDKDGSTFKAVRPKITLDDKIGAFWENAEPGASDILKETDPTLS